MPYRRLQCCTTISPPPLPSPVPTKKKRYLLPLSQPPRALEMKGRRAHLVFQVLIFGYRGNIEVVPCGKAVTKTSKFAPNLITDERFLRRRNGKEFVGTKWTHRIYSMMLTHTLFVSEKRLLQLDKLRWLMSNWAYTCQNEMQAILVDLCYFRLSAYARGPVFENSLS